MFYSFLELITIYFNWITNTLTIRLFFKLIMHEVFGS